MKKIAFLILCLIGSINLWAQDFSPMKSLVDFERRLKDESSKLQTIESDFKQIKYLDVFDEEIESTGKFYYKKLNKIRMQYNKPLDYLIVINGETLKIRADKKTSTTDLGKNKMMLQVQEMIAGCMIGDLSGLTKSYSVNYFENKEHYLLKLVPKNASIKAYIFGIEMLISKQDMSVDRLKISETETDFTVYFFVNKKLNKSIDDAIFDIN